MKILSSNIFILSSPIQTGKTTSAISWAKKQNSIAGIVQPIVDGKRHLLNLKLNELRLLEAAEGTDNTIQVGNFSFSNSTFEWAKICLLHAMKDRPKWLLIDEIGKLEMQNKGLEPVANYIVNEYKKINDRHLLIVVRDYLVDDVIAKYLLANVQVKIINKINEL